MAPQAARARKGGIQNEKASDNHSLGYCRSISCDEWLCSRGKKPVVGDIAAKTTGGQRINAFMVEKIIGSKVINVKGEALGKIEDLVVDIDTGFGMEVQLTVFIDKKEVLPV